MPRSLLTSSPGFGEDDNDEAVFRTRMLRSSRACCYDLIRIPSQDGKPLQGSRICKEASAAEGSHPCCPSLRQSLAWLQHRHRVLKWYLTMHSISLKWSTWPGSTQEGSTQATLPRFIPTVSPPPSTSLSLQIKLFSSTTPSVSLVDLPPQPLKAGDPVW